MTTTPSDSLLERLALGLCEARGEDPNGEQWRCVDGEMHGVTFLKLAERDVKFVLEASDDLVGEMDWLASNTNLELTWGELDGDMSDCAWRLHRVNGGYNDREWTLIATGETPIAAIKQARMRDARGA